MDTLPAAVDTVDALAPFVAELRAMIAAQVAAGQDVILLPETVAALVEALDGQAGAARWLAALATEVDAPLAVVWPAAGDRPAQLGCIAPEWMMSAHAVAWLDALGPRIRQAVAQARSN